MMQCWINGPATGGIDDKLKMVNILLKTNIPSFHPSIIPFPGQIRRPQKTSIFSVGCRNSETFNYWPTAPIRYYGDVLTVIFFTVEVAEIQKNVSFNLSQKFILKFI